MTSWLAGDLVASFGNFMISSIWGEMMKGCFSIDRFFLFVPSWSVICHLSYLLGSAWTKRTWMWGITTKKPDTSCLCYKGRRCLLVLTQGSDRNILRTRDRPRLGLVFHDDHSCCLLTCKDLVFDEGHMLVIVFLKFYRCRFGTSSTSYLVHGNVYRFVILQLNVGSLCWTNFASYLP